MQHEVKVGESAQYVASNQSDRALAVEVIAETWEIDPTGKEIRTPTKDLVIYPSQFILKGNTYKKIKVGQRAPDKHLSMEKAYRVTIRELPISLEPEEPGTYRVYHAAGYRTSYYVKPSKPTPKIALTGARLNGAQLAVTVENSGNAHVHLRNPVLFLSTTSGKKIAVSDGEILKPINGHNMHAGLAREFQIDLSEIDLSESVEEITFLFKDNGVLEPHAFEAPLTTE